MRLERRALRILMVAHAFPPTFGGVESHIWDVSTRLARRGFAVCCLVGGSEHSRENLDGLRIVRNPALTVRSLLSHRHEHNAAAISADLLAILIGTVLETIAEFEPDCIHIHNGHHFAPELALSLFVIARKTSVINGVHDRVGEHMFEQVMGYPWDHVLYASHYLSRSILTRAPASVRWLGIDLTLFAPDGPADPRFASLEHPIVFHPARLLRWKGTEVGLRAFIQLRKSLNRGTLVMCSSENIVDDARDVLALKKELTAMADDADVREFVRFFEFDRSLIAAAYRASDLVWYPTTDDEPFGLVPLEAMACGIPLIVSQSGGMMETVIDGHTGVVVGKNDHDALSEAARRLLTDEPFRNRLVRQGREHALAFDVESYVDGLDALYREVAQHG
jgi:glycosyltransferase involved in cell wall biosynthesis